VKLYWNTDSAAWEDLVRLCPGATYFHRGAWLDAAARSLGARFEGAVCEFSSDVIALVPLVARHRLGGLLASGASGSESCFGAYGGLLSPYPLTPEQIDQVYQAIAANVPNLAVRGNPHNPWPHLPHAEAGYHESLRHSHVVPPQALSPGTPLWPGLELLWIPGPREFHADLFGSLEPLGHQRPRAFYYHLFRQAEERQLAMLILRLADEPVAGILLGMTDGIAFNLGLFARGCDPGLMAALLAQLPERLPPGLRALDLGPDVPKGAIPSHWPRERKPFGDRQRLRFRLFERFRPHQQEAS
jgi:hypothetical protein